MARIAVFSKYFGYNVGGAERSMLSVMRDLEAEGHEIVAFLNRDPKHYGAKQRKFDLPPSWSVRWFSLPTDWTRFRFIEYLLNYRTLKKIAGSMGGIDTLYAYGHMSPAVLLGFRGKRVYLVRDEYGLGWNRNYYRGVRAALQYAYFMLEAPFRRKWMHDLQRVAASSELIANSRFIAEALNALVPGKEVRVILPEIDVRSLKSEYEKASLEGALKRGVVAVGDNVLKGGDIVRRVAGSMPDRQFYLFDRKYAGPSVSGNLACMPWQPSSGALYRHAEVVMVPSRYEEAYGRVVVEAQALGIPVVASRRGGIPEAMQDRSMLVDDIEDVDDWVRKIRECVDADDS